MVSAENLPAVLSELAWPLMVFAVFLILRKEIRSLLKRLQNANLAVVKNYFRLILLSVAAIVLASCGPSDKIWPSDRIGPMWVNRYGHSNSQPIWEYCSDRMTATPGIQTTDCTVPQVGELFIGYGVRGQDTVQRNALWEARNWELYVDGHAVDLPAFNVADFASEQNGTKYAYRVWRIRLRKIPAGLHTLRYVMHVNHEVKDDPESQSPGTYELVVNFTIEK